jgi:putative transposase
VPAAAIRTSSSSAAPPTNGLNVLVATVLHAFMPFDPVLANHSIYGAAFRRRLKGIGIDEVVSAPRSPWQNPFVERLFGSIRRECLDHVIVIGERHLRGILASYFAYYHRSRTHLSLMKDAPNHRAVTPPQAGEVIGLPEVGGLHHRYERRAA